MIPTISLDTLVPLAALTPALAAVASAAFKGALPVALAALATATLLRHRPAAARHAVWTGALATHLLLVVAAPLLPAVSLPGFRLPVWLTAGGADRPVAWTSAAAGPRSSGPIGGDPTWAAAVAVGGTRSTAQGTASTSATPTVSASAAATTRSNWQPPTTKRRGDSLTSRLGTVWLVGVLLVLGRLLLGTARVLTLARAAVRITDPLVLALAQRIANRLAITRPITMLRGDRLSIPITWGVVYPTVLLPAESVEWPEERLRVVLVHEMAHVKRLDALTQLIAQVAIAVFWFDPLVWLAARRMRAEREHACDDYVLRDGTRPSLYANELLDMVRRLADRAGEAGAPAFAALAMARRSEFEGRMLAILDPGADRHVVSRAASVACAGVALVLLAPLAALRPEHRPIAAVPGTAHAATTTVLTLPVERRSASTARASARAFASASVTAAAQATLSVTVVAAQETLPIIYKCTAADLRTRKTTNAVHTDRKWAARNFVERYTTMYGHCLHVVVVGRITFTPDERDIASLSPDGRIQIHELTFDWDRRLVVTANPDGTPRREYGGDRVTLPIDAATKAWASRVIQNLAREGGMNAPARVSRIRERGGVPAVLAEISEVESVDAKRKHYETLLESSLTPPEVEMIVRHAGVQLAGSSGDLAAVLRRLPRSSLPTMHTALETALPRMADGDKHHVLVSMLDNADAPTLRVVLHLAEQIGADGDKASFLRHAAPRVLGAASTPTIREAFFRAYGTLGADGDKQSVLLTALREGQPSPSLTLDVIRAARRIGADGDKAAVLRAVARNRLLTTDALREEYIKVARTLASDGDYRAVIDELLGGKRS